MDKTYIVAPGHEFNYPADALSLKIITQVGGRSKLSDRDLLQVKYKTVKEGDNCSDMPKETLQLFLERGWVIEK